MPTDRHEERRRITRELEERRRIQQEQKIPPPQEQELPSTPIPAGVPGSEAGEEK